MIKVLLSLLLLTNISYCLSQSSTNLEEENVVRSVIDKMFEGMKKGDSSIVHSVFHPTARLQTTFTNAKGEARLHEESIADFLVAVGTPHNEIWDERISTYNICIDDNLARVWTDYSFYVDDQFSHCGVNAFQLFKDSSGWKIIQITDTRRKTNCN